MPIDYHMTREGARLKRVAALMSALTVFLLLAAFTESRAVSVPVLLYHHLADRGGSVTIVSVRRFEEQIKALCDAGYHTVSTVQLIDYVDRGVPLPEKPIMITFDDGYESNLTLGAPVLQGYGLRATVFVIGSYAGRTVHPITGEPLSPPHFALRDAVPCIDSGVLDVQCHSYDLHRRAADSPDGREGALQRPGEEDALYRSVFMEDLMAAKEQVRRELGYEPVAYSYPYGFCSRLTEAMLDEGGIRISLLAVPGRNRAVEGDPRSLRRLRRLTVTEEMSGPRLIEELGELR